MANCKKNLRSCGTHDGSFHADEVTACALLVLFDCIDQDKIVRTRDRDLLATCEFVCDVGGEYNSKQKLFDHHQIDYVGSLSSAGMILLYLKESGKMSESEYTLLKTSFIDGVDADDNGKGPQIEGVSTYSDVIANFAPIIYSPPKKEEEEAFRSALKFAIGYTKRLLERQQFVQSCRGTVKDAMKQHDTCLFFDRAIPWQDLFFEMDGEKHPALFVIMPSGEHWILRGIPPSSDERMKVRFPQPSGWAGLLEEDLKAVTGIDGAIFCHKGRFISVWETREDAVKALNLLLKKEK